MLKKTVKYTNFLGEERTKDLYFAITSADGIRMVFSEAERGESDEDLRDGFARRIVRIANHGSPKELVDMFDEFIKASYGEIEDDGETFNQSEEVYEKFRSSAAFKQFYEDLMTDTNAMIEFVNGIFPKEWTEAAQKDPEFARHREELEKRARQDMEERRNSQ